VGSFLGLVRGMGSLAAVKALAASRAEVIFREELSLAGGAFSPELGSVLAVHVWVGNVVDEYECSNMS
jgi:hypothetical protein